jgi:hypothetical protein
MTTLSMRSLLHPMGTVFISSQRTLYEHHINMYITYLLVYNLQSFSAARFTLFISFDLESVLDQWIALRSRISDQR